MNEAPRLKYGDWEVLGPAGASIRFQQGPDSPLELQASWVLNDEGLQVDLVVANRTRSHAPFGLGVRVELGPIGDQVQALAPAEEIWPLEVDGCRVIGPRQPVSGALDLRRPRRIHAPIEALFTRRHFANLRTQAAVLDPATGREVWLTTSADFRELWLSLDQHGAGILESATCVPNASTIKDSGLRILAPGETWRGSAVLVARPSH